MLCVFAPVDFYFANSEEYWFSPVQLLAVCGTVFAAVFLLMSLLSAALVRIRSSRFILAAAFFIFIFLYIQGNIIPRNYGVLNGKAINWRQYTGYAAASIIAAAVCVSASILVCVKFRKRILKIVKLGSVYLLIILIGTTAVTAAGNTAALKKRNTQIVTTKDEFVLSENRNIVVFLLDTFDAGYFSAMLEKDYGRYASLFEDFTFYPDCVGAYPTTKAAVPYILTGTWYENRQPFAGYYQEALEGNPVYTAFSGNGYVLDVYTKSNCLSAVSSEYYNNVIPGEYSISDPAGFAGAVYRMVAFNYMPHQLKRFFWTDSESFAAFRKTDRTYTAFSTDVIKYARRLNKQGITTDREGNRFKFYHLLGVHSPYTFGEKLKTDKKKTFTVYDEAEGNFTVIRRFIRQLKNNGLYDSSTIIVMADHGELDLAQNPLFMIKNAGESHAFAVSDEKMSWEYLSDLWIDLAGGRKIDASFFSGHAGGNMQRRYLYYEWDDAWKRDYMPAMEEYICAGNVMDPESMKPTGMTYLSDTADFSYTPGTVLSFVSGRTGYDYCLYGIRYGSVGELAMLCFDLGRQRYDDLLLSVRTDPWCGDGTADLYVNDRLLTSIRYEPDSLIQAVIPREYTKEGSIVSIGIDQSGGSEDLHSSFVSSPLVISTVVLENSAGSGETGP